MAGCYPRQGWEVASPGLGFGTKHIDVNSAEIGGTLSLAPVQVLSGGDPRSLEFIGEVPLKQVKRRRRPQPQPCGRGECESLCQAQEKLRGV